MSNLKYKPWILAEIVRHTDAVQKSGFFTCFILFTNELSS